MTEISFSEGQPTTGTTKQISIFFFTQYDGRAPCMSVPIETPRSQALKTVANGLIYYSARDLKEAFFTKGKRTFFFLDEYINGSRLNKRKNSSMVP